MIPVVKNPKWLDWVRRLQAHAQDGLAYAKDPYDRERFEAVSRIAAEIAAEHTDEPADKIAGLFLSETGYATPKADVRACVFQGEEVLLVKETTDGLWSLPGGWIDAGESPSQAAARETKEETGWTVRPERLLAVYDRDRHEHPPRPFHVYKLFILCAPLEPGERKSFDTLDAGFFPVKELPPISMGRVTPRQIERMLELSRLPDAPADFD